MIITQTPLRISFFGGGTDFASFYHQQEGCVLSTAIDKFIFVVLKSRYDEKIRIGYTKTELVDDVLDLEHELVREAMLKTRVLSRIELSTLGDITTAGSGLGSSSTVTVGLLNAFYHHLGDPQPLDTLARQACEIEIAHLNKPVGKQDQYIAAFGGFRFIRFLPDERVIIEPVNLSQDDRRRFNQNLMLFFTNSTRRSETILEEQKARAEDNLGFLRSLRQMALDGRDLLENGDFDEFGALLHESWEIKKRLASKVSNGVIDEAYQAAREAGAIGGKITGAGGGGYLLLYCPVERQQKVRQVLKSLPELPFRFEMDGTKVIFNYRR